jgi:hypothetical protein
MGADNQPVVVYAGRRAGSLNGDIRALSLRIGRLLNDLIPTAVVGAMADGGDLLVVEAALAMKPGPAIDVILPTPEAVFRVRSVDAGWRDRFDRAIEHVHERGTVQSLGLADGSEAYRRANAAFLEKAKGLARDLTRVVVLVVASEGEGQMVQDLLDRARSDGIAHIRIDPRSL